MRGLARLSMALGAIVVIVGVEAVGEEPSRRVPASFAPFEHLIGAWKGVAVPATNRLKGWTEAHSWAWTFAEGRPNGLAVTMTRSKILDEGRVTFDPATETYTLQGTSPGGGKVAFAGRLDRSGKSPALVLDRVGDREEGRERLTLYLFDNHIRYSLLQERQKPGAPRFAKLIEINAGKKGESFAAGSTASDLPKCILTGGAASMTVSYQGKSYPVCCTGCRDEFNEDPEKYARQAASLATEAPAPPPAVAPKARPDDPETDASPKSKPKPADVPDGDPLDNETRARQEYRLGLALEKAGKRSGALDYYRRVVEDYPDTKAAADARRRIKALSGD